MFDLTASLTHAAPRNGFGWWTVDRSRLIFLDPSADALQWNVKGLDLQTGKTQVLASAGRQPSMHDQTLALSPDGRNIVVTQVEGSGGTLLLLENFR